MTAADHLVRPVRERLAALLALVVLLSLLCVWFGTLGPAPSMGAYPGGEELAGDYDQYVGEQVAIGGEVVETEPVVVRLEFAAHPDLLLTVTGLETQPERGDHLHVFGVVRPETTIEATTAFAVPRTGHWYTWTVSFLAGLWVLGRILNQWRVDRSDWTLVTRATTWLARRRGAD